MASVLVMLACSILSAGCYYGHLAGGQARVLWSRRAVDDVLRDPETTPALRERLALVARVRAYATTLGLDVSGQYTSYVAWPGDRIVTSLVVTEPGSIEARPFSFPIVGEVPYKGYFDVERARRDAERWAAEGYDTCLVPVPAYSTLGFFDDPLTDPMLRFEPGRLVEMVLHELVHATVFLASEPELNEGAANFVGEEASVRFYADDPARAARRRAEVEDDRRLDAALMALRERIAALYAEPLDEATRRRRREALEAEARAALAALPLSTRDPGRLADAIPLGDACLALRGAYVADTPRHAAILAALDDDLPAFVARFVAAAETDDPRATFFAGLPADRADPVDLESAADPGSTDAPAPVAPLEPLDPLAPLEPLEP